MKFSLLTKPLTIQAKCFSKLAAVLLLLSGLSGVVAQEAELATLSAYEIMEKVDKQLAYPDGLTKAQLTTIARNGSSSVTKGTLYKKGADSLFIFDSISRGRELKLLYNDYGFNIYAYFYLEKKFYHKREQDKYDLVLGTAFNYQDLGNLSLLENYTPKINGTEVIGGKKMLRILNIPLDKGMYSKLNVLVDPETYDLVRIDYFDKAGVLTKTFESDVVDFSIKTQEGKLTSEKYAARRNMANLATGVITTLEFFTNDKTARLDDSLFKAENIEK